MLGGSELGRDRGDRFGDSSQEHVGDEDGEVRQSTANRGDARRSYRRRPAIGHRSSQERREKENFM